MNARTTKKLGAGELVRRLEHDPEALKLVAKIVENPTAIDLETVARLVAKAVENARATMRVRDADDPRVREIMRTLELVLAFQAEDRARTGEYDALEGPIDSLIARGVIGQRTFDGWSDDAVRALVLAFVTNAPDEHFEQIVGAVRGERKWTREYRSICEREVWPKHKRASDRLVADEAVR